MHHRHDPHLLSAPARGSTATPQPADPAGSGGWRFIARLFEPRPVANDGPSMGASPPDPASADPSDDALFDAVFGALPALPSPGRLRRLVASASPPKALQASWLHLTDALAAYLDRRDHLGTDRAGCFLPHPEVDCSDLSAMVHAIDDLELQADGVSHLIRGAAAGGSDLAMSALGIALGDVSRALEEEGLRMRSARALLC